MSIAAIKALRTAQNNLAPSRGAAITYGDGDLWDEYEHAIQSIEQAQKQEPVAEMMKNPSDGHLYVQYTKPFHLIGAGAKFYTSPPQRHPLTDERILEILGIHLDEDDDIEDWRSEINEARAIEAAHGIMSLQDGKEKNTRNGDCL